MNLWNNIILQAPLWLLLLEIIPVIIIYRIQRRRTGLVQTVPIPTMPEKVPDSLKARLHKWMEPLFWFAIALFIIALARPQRENIEEVVKGEGIDIFLVMDLSSSMLAKDFDPDRLAVSKQVAIDFVSHRKYDRIGLVVFAAESYTQCPLTNDHQVLTEYLQSLECGRLEDGTAIGMGLAAAVNRLKDSEAKSKVVVLLTDGVNNAGYIRPSTAADVAVQFGIKVYTIGIGTYGQAYTPVSRRSDGKYYFALAAVEIDEKLLQEIADQTGGKYYRATSAERLQRVYEEIDRLEKTKVEVTVFKRAEELYYWPLLGGFILLTLLFVLRATYLKTLP